MTDKTYVFLFLCHWKTNWLNLVRASQLNCTNIKSHKYIFNLHPSKHLGSNIVWYYHYCRGIMSVLWRMFSTMEEIPKVLMVLLSSTEDPLQYWWYPSTHNHSTDGIISDYWTSANVLTVFPSPTILMIFSKLMISPKNYWTSSTVLISYIAQHSTEFQQRAVQIKTP